MRLIIKVIYIMELINIRNNKRVYVKDEDIVDGIYHFKYKIDFSQTPEKIQKDKEYISKLKYQIALYDIKSDNFLYYNNINIYIVGIIEITRL